MNKLPPCDHDNCPLSGCNETPRTDAAFEGDLSVNLQPEIKTWEEAKDFTRTLERELTAAIREIVELREELALARKELEK